MQLQVERWLVGCTSPWAIGRKRPNSPSATRNASCWYSTPGYSRRSTNPYPLSLGWIADCSSPFLGWRRRGSPATRKHEHGGGERRQDPLPHQDRTLTLSLSVLWFFQEHQFD